MANERLNPQLAGGGIVNDEIAALKQEIAELKKQTEYHPGDSINNSDYYIAVSMCWNKSYIEAAFFLAKEVGSDVNAATLVLKNKASFYTGTQNFTVEDASSLTTSFVRVMGNTAQFRITSTEFNKVTPPTILICSFQAIQITFS